MSVACFRHIGLFLNFAFCIVHGEVYRLRDHFGFWVTQISRCSIYQPSAAFSGFSLFVVSLYDLFSFRDSLRTAPGPTAAVTQAHCDAGALRPHGGGGGPLRWGPRLHSTFVSAAHGNRDDR